ncbi:hypothetical protein [Maribacter sp. 2308TA10-17]|uniref:hypothetical protein n=1 Tax=Maribacter sp. 2308TA10-17 TaxID=3386276 RepID=UPI0039BD7158
MKSTLVYLLIITILLSCRKDGEVSSSANQNSHIEYFGFTIIDTYWDDPTDSESKTNYADEIHNFSNLADVLVVSPNADLTQRIQTFADLDLKAILHLNELFFELIDTNSPSGSNYNLRPDYKDRWNEFKDINLSILNTNYIGALYIGEEPTWNGITFTELNSVSQLLKTDFPSIPSMIIEAYPSLSDLQIPETVDWIGFDRYFIKNPNTNSEFQKDWALLKSKISNPTQKIMVILDSHFIDWAHGDLGNIDLTQMDEVANNYYILAKSDEKVVGILGYFWPNGFDIPESIGARGMPEKVISEYQRIGKEITGKNN